MGKQIGNVNTENAFLVRARPDIVEPKFLDFALQNTVNQGGLERVAQGTTSRKAIRKDDLKNLELEVEPRIMGMVVKPTIDEVAEVSTARGKLLQKGDIIVSNRGTVGRTEFIEKEIQAKDGFRGNVKKGTNFRVGENGAEFVEVFPLDLEDVMSKRKLGQSKFLQKQSRKNVFAKNGFMGTLNFSTIFTVGEGNKKEFVNVFNVSDKLSGFPSAVNTKEKFINKKKSKKKNNNIFDVGF